jgi:hypothetical protein
MIPLYASGVTRRRQAPADRRRRAARSRAVPSRTREVTSSCGGLAALVDLRPSRIVRDATPLRPGPSRIVRDATPLRPGPSRIVRDATPLRPGPSRIVRDAIPKPNPGFRHGRFGRRLCGCGRWRGFVTDDSRGPAPGLPGSGLAGPGLPRPGSTPAAPRLGSDLALPSRGVR